jgi:rRNA processing
VERAPRREKKEFRKKLTQQEKLALAEERWKEKERNNKEREKKIKQREKKRRDLRKMTSKGQPVMKTRLEDLLSKVKKVMKET